MFALVAAFSFLAGVTGVAAPAPIQYSGIYPQLAMFNSEGECGTGAVVPWADRLWVITYGPHLPKGSSDKLYEITPDLKQLIYPGSIGGTPANRMIHRESEQLFIGPYAIDARRNVRVIPYSKMFGRHTGNARHLTDPAGKIYYATMEEGLYEVDVRTLAVTELYADEQIKEGRHADLPGYHGKGLYSGQGRLIYANNGEHAADYTRLDMPSGCLAEWDGKDWRVVRRSQFTEVTGPGGLVRQCPPGQRPGVEHRLGPSVAHPDVARPRQVAWLSAAEGEPYLRRRAWLAHRMAPHQGHWGERSPHDDARHAVAVPQDLFPANSAGLAPRSAFLKITGDFCRWHDRVVFGCDDSARNEFSNRHKFKAGLATPGESQSNLWFVEPSRLDQLGTPLGRGGVWVEEAVKANETSEPFLFSGFDYRGVHLAHGTDTAVIFTFEVDLRGNNHWTRLRELEVPAHGYTWTAFAPEQKGPGFASCQPRLPEVTAYFQYANAGRDFSEAPNIFAGLARTGDRNIQGALLYARGEKSERSRLPLTPAITSSTGK